MQGKQVSLGLTIIYLLPPHMICKILGCIKEECSQQVKGGSPSPLLCPGEAPSAVLGSPVQER